jgi:serine protease
MQFSILREPFMFMRNLLVNALLILLCSTQLKAQHADNYDVQYFPQSYGEAGVDYNPGVIFVKLKPEHRNFFSSSPAWQALQERFKLNNPKQAFPFLKQPDNSPNSFGMAKTDLTLIWEFELSPPAIPMEKFIGLLLSTDLFQWAEPEFFVSPLATVPNDPSALSQWHLNNIRVFDAWDSTQGDTNVIIAIVDGGTSFTHPELIDNVKYNWNDPIDGIDNDGDGFIDNFRGWNTGDWNNNPTWDVPGTAEGSIHGTMVTSVVSASTNNGVGVAGVAWNCKYIPVKLVRSGAGWVRGYQGVVYAANFGVDIINCSWGGAFPSRLGEDAVRFAVWDRNCLVIAAAGNGNNSNLVYPSAFVDVLGVTSSNAQNSKWGSGSFYEEVRMSAPGGQLVVAYGNNTYSTESGSSNAAPVVSGVAALVKSRFSGYTPLQAGAQVEATSYNVDTIPANAAFAGRLGFGRVDALSAMSPTPGAWCSFYDRKLTDRDGDAIVLVGDTGLIHGKIINWLQAGNSGITAQINSNSPFIQLLDSIVNLGNLASMQFADISASPFSFALLPGAPVDHWVRFKVTFNDGPNFVGHTYFSIFVNPSHYNWKYNKHRITVTSTGRLGYPDATTQSGLGWASDQFTNHLLEQFYPPFSFMLGRAGWVSNQTLSAPLSSCCPLANDNHFQPIAPIQKEKRNKFGHERLVSRFNDAGAGANAIGLDITRYAYGDSAGPGASVLYLDHFFFNPGNTAINDIYAGYYCDTDVPNIHFIQNPNQAAWDNVNNAGLQISSANTNGIGIVLPNNYPVHYYAFDVSGTGGSIVVTDGFTQTEKWQVMTNGISRASSFVGDNAQYMGSYLPSVAPQSCAVLPMALVIGDNLSSLQAAANVARQHLNSINVWTGAAGTSDWHTGQNWSKGSVPTQTDKVFIVKPSAPGGQDPVISGADGFAAYVETLCGGNLRVVPGRNLWVGP